MRRPLKIDYYSMFKDDAYIHNSKSIVNVHMPIIEGVAFNQVHKI